jgi:prophage antirepressor-like protein
MSNQLNFDFNSNQIRVINDNPNNPSFVAKDVALALGYKDTINAIKTHCKDGVANHHPITDKLGRAQNVAVIGEPDLYRLIFGSKLKSAKAFQDWVFEQVLPSIRKTGKYENPNPRARFLSEEQCGHIYQTVNNLCHSEQYTHQFLYGQLKRQFQVSTYKDILKTDYPQACHFLGVRPIDEQVKLINETPIRDFECEELKQNAKYSSTWNKVAQHRWHELESLTIQLQEIARKIGHTKSNLFDPIFEQNLFKYVDKDMAMRTINNQNKTRH